MSGLQLSHNSLCPTLPVTRSLPQMTRSQYAVNTTHLAPHFPGFPLPRSLPVRLKSPHINPLTLLTFSHIPINAIAQGSTALRPQNRFILASGGLRLSDHRLSCGKR
ncbi:MAG: hypothetical protein AAFW75_08065 [Cyanobacteria bacterium J06636_16]